VPENGSIPFIFQDLRQYFILLVAAGSERHLKLAQDLTRNYNHHLLLAHWRLLLGV
jgi:hypothetical protein